MNEQTFKDRTAHSLSMGRGLEKVPKTIASFKTPDWLTAISVYPLGSKTKKHDDGDTFEKRCIVCAQDDG